MPRVLRNRFQIDLLIIRPSLSLSRKPDWKPFRNRLRTDAQTASQAALFRTAPKGLNGARFSRAAPPEKVKPLLNPDLCLGLGRRRESGGHKVWVTEQDCIPFECLGKLYRYRFPFTPWNFNGPHSGHTNVQSGIQSKKSKRQLPHENSSSAWADPRRRISSG
jgi:hypothetical protein